MKNNEKIILYTLLGLVAAASGYYFFYKKDGIKLGSRKRGKALEGEGESAEIDTDIPSSKFPLKRGSRGAEVLALQQYLNRSPMCKGKMPISTPTSRIAKTLPLDEDGIFGEITERALVICYDTKELNESLWKRMSSAIPSLTVED